MAIARSVDNSISLQQVDWFVKKWAVNHNHIILLVQTEPNTFLVGDYAKANKFGLRVIHPTKWIGLGKS